MKIIKEYQTLIENIAALKSEISRKERHLNKLINIYKPADVSAIEYSHDNIRGSRKKHEFKEVAQSISELQLDIKCLKEEVKQLTKQRKELEKTVNGLDDTEKQVIMHHMRNPNIPVRKLARMFYISKSTAYNYLSKMSVK